MSAVVLDNEAAQALAASSHPKHQRTLSFLESQATRARRRKGRSSRWVPTTVRAEAGWDRTDPAAATINRMNIRDHPLDEDRANAAARSVLLHGVSPADAHVGAVVDSIRDEDVVVLTSDPDDIAQVCPPGRVRIIRI